MAEQSKYNVIISTRATRMLVSHVAFLASVNEDAAGRLTDDFEEAASSLKMMPHRCPWFEQPYIPKNKYRSLLFGKRYLMLFQIKDHTVFLDYVLDCRQDYQWLLY